MKRLSLRQVTKVFRNPNGEEIRALADIGLEVAAGELVVLVGSSGCGKTTLLRMIAGLERPTSGSIAVGGSQVSGPGPDRAMIFQQPALLPWRTVAGNVAYPLEVLGVSKSDRERRVDGLLVRVGLAEFGDFYPHQLSGGMRQRADIARALAVNPEVLLADEPFGALDAMTRNTMQGELLQVWQRERTTILFVTHSVDEAAFLADRVIVLSERPGQIVDSVEVKLPHPRDRTAPDFVALRRRILAQVQVRRGETTGGVVVPPDKLKRSWAAPGVWRGGPP